MDDQAHRRHRIATAPCGTAWLCCDMEAAYEIAATAKQISDGGYQRVALQFPDSQLASSAAVARALAAAGAGAAALFIIGDTSYGSDCVDEVAAAHFAADLVVHYGQASLSPVCRLPVLYVFGRASLDVADCGAAAARLFDAEEPVLVLCDQPYAHAIPELRGALAAALPRAHVADIMRPGLQLPGGADGEQGFAEMALLGAERIWDFGGLSAAERTELPILYVGATDSTAVCSLILRRAGRQFCAYDPETLAGREETVAINRTLKRRYFLVQKAKEAEVVCIVVGTLGMKGHVELVAQLKRTIAAAGKKSYAVIIGKLNAAKLANFADADIFVLVASPYNSIIDARELYKPVVTPFELEIALTPGCEWTGDYDVDMVSVLGRMRERNAAVGPEEGEGDAAEGGEIVPLGRRDVSTWVSAGAERLNAREWTGLDASEHRKMTELVEGRSGKATGYDGEAEATCTGEQEK